MKKLALLCFGILFFCAGVSAQVSVGPISLTGSACASIDATGLNTVGIYASGTWSGTIQPEGSLSGQKPFNSQVTPAASSTPQATITGNGGFVASVAGLNTFLLCGNTVTGTAVIFMNGSQATFVTGAGGGSLSFASLTGGTNSTAAMVVGTGASLLTSGTGQIRATALSPYSTAQTAPGTVNESRCASMGFNAFMWVPLNAGGFAEQACIDTFTNNNFPAGNLLFDRHIFINDDALASSQQPFNNALLSVSHLAGQGTSLSNQDRAIGATIFNTVGDVSQHKSMAVLQAEMDIKGAPTWGPGPDAEASALSVQVDDLTSNNYATPNFGTNGLRITMFRDVTTVTTHPYTGINIFLQNDSLSGGGGQAYTGVNVNFNDESVGGPQAGINAVGFLASTPISGARFASTTGFQSNNMGTNAADYDLFMGGVNAGGTPAGFSALIGPTSFGASTHPANGDQIAITGKWSSTDVLRSYDGFTTAGIGLPVEVGNSVLNAQTTSLGPTTLFTVGASTASFLVKGSVYCTTATATATVALTINYTDASNTAQAINPSAAACTTLGASSFDLVLSPIEAKNATAITYSTTAVNSPGGYRVSVQVYQLTSN